MTPEILPGTRVTYACAPYVVQAVEGDLLRLVGETVLLPGRRGRVRPPCLVLVGDVTVVERSEGSPCVS